MNRWEYLGKRPEHFDDVRADQRRMVSPGLIRSLVPAVRSALLFELEQPVGGGSAGGGYGRNPRPTRCFASGKPCSTGNPLNVTTNHRASKHPAPTRLPGSKTCHTRRVQASKRSSENSLCCKEKFEADPLHMHGLQLGQSSVLSGSNVVAMRTCFMSDEDEADQHVSSLGRVE